MEKDRFTLVTGASKGIGKAIAQECAKRGRNLILVALREDRLYMFAKHLGNKYPELKIKCYPINLAKNGGVEELFDWTKREGLIIDMLVNNAGIGGEEVFLDSDIKDNDIMMKLNMVAPVHMTKCFLPQMVKLPAAHILNVGSVGGFSPIPYKSVYAATKAFMISFSQGLRGELSNTGVKVTTLCPGPVMTNPDVTERIKSMGLIGRLVTLSSEQVAQRGVAGALKGKRMIIPGFLVRLILFFSFAVPKMLHLKVASKTLGEKQVDRANARKGKVRESVPMDRSKD